MVGVGGGVLGALFWFRGSEICGAATVSPPRPETLTGGRGAQTSTEALTRLIQHSLC